MEIMKKQLRSRIIKSQSYYDPHQANINEAFCHIAMLKKRGWWLDKRQYFFDGEIYISYLSFSRLTKEEAVDLIAQCELNKTKLDEFTKAMEEKYGELHDTVGSACYSNSEDVGYWELYNMELNIRPRADFYARYYGI